MYYSRCAILLGFQQQQLRLKCIWENNNVYYFMHCSKYLIGDWNQSEISIYSDFCFFLEFKDGSQYSVRIL